MIKRSLGTTLLVSLLLATILPLLLTMAATLFTISSRLQFDAYANMRAVAESIATVADRYLSTPARVLESIDTFLKIESDHQKHQELLLALAKPRSDIDAIIITDPEGIVIHYSPYELRHIGIDLSGEPGLLNAYEQDTVIYSQPYLAISSGRITVSAYARTGNEIGVVQLNLDKLSESIQALRPDPEDRIGIIDSRRRFLAHTEPDFVTQQRHSQPLSQADNAVPLLIEDGRKWLVAEHEIPGTEWRVLYYRPREKVFAVLQILNLNTLNIGILALAGALIGALWLRRLILQPLSTLTAKTTEIASGQYDHRIEGSFPREIEAFAEAFNSMANSVQKRDAALQSSEARYRLFFTRMGTPALLVHATEETIIDANPAAVHYYGYPANGLKNMPMGKISIDSEKATGNYQARHRLENGEIRDVIISSAPMELEGRDYSMLLVFDITDRRIAEERIQQALSEKTILLKEVHHRVKNNLQIITSLLELQVPSLHNEDDVELFRTSQSRIKSMAIVHELLYKSSDLASISMRSYFDCLIGEINAMGSTTGIFIQTKVDDLFLPIDTALPCGLILNELLTNAVKYAKKPDSDCQVLASFVKKDAELVLTVKDDGPGIPAQVQPENSPSLGFSLVMALTSQLDGKMEWKPAAPEAAYPGAEITISFSA
ncbi:MAG: HAMP domain-containing protein [Spirochaetes bacterium]|nr:HAMP domain-containing protein [Spirochaetota bacterium]MBU0955781.1 HAMP domain-containing protein [Spirochaetota bacterium]